MKDEQISSSLIHSSFIPPMNEHTLIQKYFAPLAERFSGGLNLTDDAAILDIPEGQQLIVTKDAIAEGVHYLPGTVPALIAQKLLRTNLSDLASMGATPFCYFLAVALPSLEETFLARFAQGLAEDQHTFGISLAGGDSITTHGTATFSLTALGLVPTGTALKRSGAKAGDAIYVTGTLGDAALGLIRGKGSGVSIQEEDFLVQRYQLPQPRLSEGQALRGYATACMDISDGLLIDADKLCEASGVGAEIHQELLPLSPAAKALLAASPELETLITSGGDDYELLFTLPAAASLPAHVNATCIGRITLEKNVRLMHKGKEKKVEKRGYVHPTAE